mgnify:CR=1 FL=1
MTYYVVDEGGERKYSELQDALSDAKTSIECAREYCDPEWPTWVEDIAIYEAADDCECAYEEGVILYRATETDVRDAEEGDGCDYFCDYKMMPTQKDASHD